MEPGLNLRYLKAWRSIGLMMIVAAFVVSLIPSPLRITSHYVDKQYHFITYASMMYWFVQIYGRERHLWLAIGFVAMGAAIEGLQYLTGYRMAEFLDAVANTVGVVVGWALFQTPLGQLVQRLDKGIQHLSRIPENQEK